MDFYTYMMKKYKGKERPEGDLAGDMELDYRFFSQIREEPFEREYALIKNHLWEENACQDCMKVFEKCWKRYVKAFHPAGKHECVANGDFQHINLL